MLGKLLKALFGPSAADLNAAAATAAATAAQQAAVILERAAQFNADAAAAIAANDGDRMRAVMSAIDAAPDDVIRQVPTRDLRHALRAWEREQHWVTRHTVDTFEGEPVYYADRGVQLSKRGSTGALLLMATRAVYLGDRRIELPLAKVYHVHAAIEDVGRDDSIATMSIQLAKQQRSTKFYFYYNDDRDAALWWVRTLARAAKTAGPPPVAPAIPTPAPAAEVIALAAAGEYDTDDGTEDETEADDLLDFETDVVGESFDGRPQHIRAITQRVERYDPRVGARFQARLVPEPTNEYDANAVAVVDLDSGEKLGYLSRTLAKRYQPAVLASANTVVPAIVRGDTDLGVCVDLTQFNTAAGLPSPEDILAEAGTYFERRSKAGDIDGAPWRTHRELAIEAASLDQHDVAAEHFEKAVRGWLALQAFDGKGPSAVLFDEYTRWYRKAKRPDLELTVLRTYMNTVAAQESGSTRADRMQKRLAALASNDGRRSPF